MAVLEFSSSGEREGGDVVRWRRRSCGESALWAVVWSDLIASFSVASLCSSSASCSVTDWVGQEPLSFASCNCEFSFEVEACRRASRRWSWARVRVESESEVEV